MIRSARVEYRIYTIIKARVKNGRFGNVNLYWDTFDEFFDYVGERPSKKFSLVRFDLLKGFEPGNIGWRKQRTAQVMIEYEGKKYSVKEFAKKLKIKKDTLYSRIYNGWTVEDIVNGTRNKVVIPKKLPKDRDKKIKVLREAGLSWRAIEKETKINRETARKIYLKSKK